jgi:hypothetical protein
MGEDLRGRYSGMIGLYSDICLGKEINISVTISSVLAEIRTEHLPNMNPERYRYDSPLGQMFESTC